MRVVKSIDRPVVLWAGDVEEVGVFSTLEAAERGGESYTRRVFAEQGWGDPTFGGTHHWTWLEDDRGRLHAHLTGTLRAFMQRERMPDGIFIAHLL